MNLEAVDLAMVAAMGGGGSYVGTLVANKTDIAWMKNSLKRAHERIDELWQYLAVHGRARSANRED